MGTGGPEAATAAGPTAGQRARRARAVVAAVVLLVAAAALLAWSGGQRGRGYLEPGAVDPQGARALARLLEGQGVAVRPVRTAAEAAATGPDATLLVTSPQALGGRVRDAVAAARPGALVVVDPGSAVGRLVPGVRAVGFLRVADRGPACSDPVAVRAGGAVVGGTTMEAAAAPGADDGSGGGSAAGCYGDPDAEGAPLLVLPARDGRPRTALLGSGAPLTNDRLADAGNAALALGLLGGHPTLVWYLPSLADPLAAGDGPASVGDLLPGWTGWALLQLLVAAAALALWRGHRLGPVVGEPLPVVVRAAEATEGRARLYRRAGARDRAAEALRRAGRDRLATACGLPAGADPAAVVAAVSARSPLPPDRVGDLLYGPAPADDDALVALSYSLKRLEVR